MSTRLLVHGAHPLQLPLLDPRREEVAEAGADPGLVPKLGAAHLYVDDDTDRCPANLGRSVRLIEPDFRADEEVQYGDDPV